MGGPERFFLPTKIQKKFFEDFSKKKENHFWWPKKRVWGPEKFLPVLAQYKGPALMRFWAHFALGKKSDFEKSKFIGGESALRPFSAKAKSEKKISKFFQKKKKMIFGGFLSGFDDPKIFSQCW